VFADEGNFDDVETHASGAAAAENHRNAGERGELRVVKTF